MAVWLEIVTEIVFVLKRSLYQLPHHATGFVATRFVFFFVAVLHLPQPSECTEMVSMGKLQNFMPLRFLYICRGITEEIQLQWYDYKTIWVEYKRTTFHFKLTFLGWTHLDQNGGKKTEQLKHFFGTREYFQSRALHTRSTFLFLVYLCSTRG